MVYQQSGPFFELKNVCPLEISIHFPNMKESSQDGLFFNLENNVLNNMSVLPPNLESHSSLSTKGFISTIPIFSRKYANFILERGFVRIFVACSSVGMY
jgi:hypothetical protein